MLLMKNKKIFVSDKQESKVAFKLRGVIYLI